MDKQPPPGFAIYLGMAALSLLASLALLVIILVLARGRRRVFAGISFGLMVLGVLNNLAYLLQAYLPSESMRYTEFVLADAIMGSFGLILVTIALLIKPEPKQQFPPQNYGVQPFESRG